MNRLSFAILIAAALSLALACGGESISDSSADTQNEGLVTQLVKPSERTLTVADFEAVGLKHSKDYKTDGLPSANGVSLFFWKIDGNPVQYEVRFYDTHEDAVKYGKSFAIEGAGPEAIIDPDFARYTEGLRDRRTIVHTRGSPTPRYGDFFIYANVIALCEGRDATQGAERCARLLQTIESND